MLFNKDKADALARDIRRNLMIAIASKGSGHVGGSLSIADALAVLYSGVLKYDPADPGLPDRDFVVLSKGHTGPALYATLALSGFFPVENLKTLNQNDTMLPSHADRLHTPGVDVSTGSLGQGASLAAGVAFANALDHRESFTYLIVGDGELDEGQVWECALFAAHRGLDRLITIVDANGKQLDGTTDEVCALGSIEDKFAAFGFNVLSVAQGNDTRQIYDAIVAARACRGKPSAIVLHTVKGAGIRRYEQMANCHSVNVSQDDLAAVLAELDER